ncbi:ASCH domain-containing protein [Vibrio sp. JC009]|uniref:ASCH domain-containing protein n=1 Tax=Vibrio sp. JC009 TaxID=2912314 RepID=UPI0023AF9B2D|nr:ASCH domain-containing protein [Vibrio sp. JC009]WED24415.1 ASCH domain-containing protein [Vibrio sp. JC009]
MNQVQQKFLDAYLDSLTPSQRERHSKQVADCFCADEENANICAQLILAGEKTATCSMKHWYENGQEEMPKVGDIMVVTDWNGNPTSIIETTEVSVCKFSEVTAEFAASEGEGDKSLEWWRKAHWEFFSDECEKEGIAVSEDMLLVLERFKVVYL